MSNLFLYTHKICKISYYTYYPIVYIYIYMYLFNSMIQNIVILLQLVPLPATLHSKVDFCRKNDATRQQIQGGSGVQKPSPFESLNAKNAMLKDFSIS